MEYNKISRFFRIMFMVGATLLTAGVVFLLDDNKVRMSYVIVAAGGILLLMGLVGRLMNYLGNRK